MNKFLFSYGYNENSFLIYNEKLLQIINIEHKFTINGGQFNLFLV